MAGRQQWTASGNTLPVWLAYAHAPYVNAHSFCFHALIVTQMIWGLSWTFSTGADVAWMTDELDQPNKTAEALISAAKWGYAGSAVGILALGALAWATSLSFTIVTAGVAMWLLGIFVALVFHETKFEPPEVKSQITSALHIFREGLSRIRAYRILLHILVCTYLVNGADEAFGRLYAKQLVDVGLPAGAAPIIWLSLLSIATLGMSIVALEITDRYLHHRSNYSRAYCTGTILGVAGLILFALSSSPEMAMVGVLAVSGIAMSVMRTVSVIWANQNATTQVRATIQSFLSMSENLGEASLGFLLALIAEFAGIPAAMVASSVVLLFVILLVEKRARHT